MKRSTFFYSLVIVGTILFLAIPLISPYKLQSDHIYETIDDHALAAGMENRLLSVIERNTSAFTLQNHILDALEELFYAGKEACQRDINRCSSFQRGLTLLTRAFTTPMLPLSD